MLDRLKSALVKRMASTVDVGAVLQSFFFSRGTSYSWLSASPATLAGSVGFADGEQSLIEHSRRLCRIQPLLIAYQLAMTGGILTGESEAPTFGPAVPDAVAEAAADLWGERHAEMLDLEHDALSRLIVDGDVLVMESGDLVPADAFEAVTHGPAWALQVTAWKIGKSQEGRRAGILYVGKRRAGAVRAAPWVAGALPFAAGLVNARVSGAHAVGSLARLAMLLKADAVRQLGVGRGVRSGVDTGEDQDNARVELTSTGVGAVPLLRPGESTERAKVGPDEVAQAFQGVLEQEVAAALHVPLSELRSDYSSGSYSNLRMAAADAEREYGRRRRWFHRAFRLPMYLEALSGWFADGRLSGVTPPIMAAMKRSLWAGPRREPAQPEKEMMALAALIRAGLTMTEATALLEREGE